MGQVISSVLNWLLCAYKKRNPTSPRLPGPLQNTDHVITIVDDHRDQSDYWSTVVDPDHDFPNQDQNWGELVRYDGEFEGGAFDDQVSTPSTSSEEQSTHCYVDHPKEVKPLSIVVVDNGKQSTPFRGDYEELRKFVDVISRPIEEIKQEIWIKHYCSSHKILLVGEGDFSFSACLGRAFGRADNMVATSLNSQEFLKRNYGNAMSNVDSLRSRGCIVIHNVDATKMAGNRRSNDVTFDRIVYNFPHAGFSKNEHVKDHLRRNRDLVSDFMANAAKMIDETGEIHISHKCYNTKYGYGGDKNFDCNPSRTYKFRLKDRDDHLVLGKRGNLKNHPHIADGVDRDYDNDRESNNDGDRGIDDILAAAEILTTTVIKAYQYTLIIVVVDIPTAVQDPVDAPVVVDVAFPIVIVVVFAIPIDYVRNADGSSSFCVVVLALRRE
ncbi:hypothetical protein Syun_010641 [Stephania yunnanensis]|uniref:25S rRNA (uridine-N(3))-methyltransferase BMT5-like domain-containing protein n=1 Tax=Stephania yunnanensis TaxID=152371 RepID=A0AAP0PQ55_9MAGN